MILKIVFQATLFSQNQLFRRCYCILCLLRHIVKHLIQYTIKLNYGLYNIIYICVITELKWNLQNAVENEYNFILDNFRNALLSSNKILIPFIGLLNIICFLFLSLFLSLTCSLYYIHHVSLLYQHVVHNMHAHYVHS